MVLASFNTCNITWCQNQKTWSLTQGNKEIEDTGRPRKGSLKIQSKNGSWTEHGKAVMQTVIKSSKASHKSHKRSRYLSQQFHTSEHSHRISCASPKTSHIWLESSRQISWTVQLWNRGKKILLTNSYSAQESKRILIILNWLGQERLGCLETLNPK